MCARVRLYQEEKKMTNMADAGLCVNCAHQNTCTFSKMENKVFCEEYEYDTIIYNQNARKYLMTPIQREI